MVCAATWLMPAALVARAWDFPDPPPPPSADPNPAPGEPHPDTSSPLAPPPALPAKSPAPLVPSSDQNRPEQQANTGGIGSTTGTPAPPIHH